MSTANRIDELRLKFNENPRRYFAPLANEYRKAGDLVQAIALCREHLPKQPGHMSGYIVFGQALFEARQFEEAQEVFEQALALDPENLIALRHLGDIALAKNRPSLARRWYERVLDADPRNDDIAAQLVSLAGMSTPRGGLPAIDENIPAAPPVSSPFSAPPAPATPAPVLELPPVKFTPRHFEPIDLEMPRVTAYPTPAYPPHIIDVPPIPTPDSGLRAVDSFPVSSNAEPTHPISDALDAFAAFDPAHALEEQFGESAAASSDALDEDLTWLANVDAGEHVDANASARGTDSPATPSHEGSSGADMEPLDFEEGLVAPEWPDTQALVARINTPVRSATPIFTPIEPAALDAFGHEERDYRPPVESDPQSVPGLDAIALSSDATPPAAEHSVADFHAEFDADVPDFLEGGVENRDARDSVDDGALPPVAAAAQDNAGESAEDFARDFEAVDSDDIIASAFAADGALEDAGVNDVHSPDWHPAPDESTPRHSIDIGLVASFEDVASHDETAAPSSLPFASPALDADAPVEQTDAPVPTLEDTVELPWLSAFTAADAPDSSLGEPTFADYASDYREHSETSREEAVSGGERIEFRVETQHPDESNAEAQAIDENAAVDVPAAQMAAEHVPEEYVSAADASEEHAHAEHATAEHAEDLMSYHALFAAPDADAEAVHDSGDEVAHDGQLVDAPESDAVVASTMDLVDAHELSNELPHDEEEQQDALGVPAGHEVQPSVTGHTTEATHESTAVESPEASFADVMDEDLQRAVDASPLPLSEAHVAAANPAPAMPTPAIGSAAFVTETMAELLVSQGFIVRAVEVYEELVRRRPYDPVLTSRLAELRDIVAASPVSVPTPRTVTPVASTPLASTPIAKTPAFAAPAVPTPQHVPQYRQTPLSATPVYSTPVSNTPLSTFAVVGTPITVPAFTDDADAPERRTARERFALLARRRVVRRTPPRATAAVDEPADGLASLFGTSGANPADDAAAQALADAFSPVNEGGPSLFEPEQAAGATRATPIGTTAYPTPQPQRTSRGGGSDFSFDRFFPDPASQARPGATTTPAPGSAAVQPDSPASEDHAQFSAWLKGLTKP